MAPPRPNTPSRHRSNQTKKAELYPEAEIGILNKEPRPSKPKPPSRHHHRPPTTHPIEAEAQASTHQIETLLGLAQATIPTSEDPPSPRQWAKYFANLVCSLYHHCIHPSAVSAFSTLLHYYPFPPSILITTRHLHISI